jgi:hypothetical protein
MLKYITKGLAGLAALATSYNAVAAPVPTDFQNLDTEVSQTLGQVVQPQNEQFDYDTHCSPRTIDVPKGGSPWKKTEEDITSRGGNASEGRIGTSLRRNGDVYLCTLATAYRQAIDSGDTADWKQLDKVYNSDTENVNGKYKRGTQEKDKDKIFTDRLKEITLTRRIDELGTANNAPYILVQPITLTVGDNFNPYSYAEERIEDLDGDSVTHTVIQTNVSHPASPLEDGDINFATQGVFTYNIEATDGTDTAKRDLVVIVNPRPNPAPYVNEHTEEVSANGKKVNLEEIIRNNGLVGDTNGKVVGQAIYDENGTELTGTALRPSFNNRDLGKKFEYTIKVVDNEGAPAEGVLSVIPEINCPTVTNIRLVGTDDPTVVIRDNHDRVSVAYDLNTDGWHTDDVTKEIGVVFSDNVTKDGFLKTAELGLGVTEVSVSVKAGGLEYDPDFETIVVCEDMGAKQTINIVKQKPCLDGSSPLSETQGCQVDFDGSIRNRDSTQTTGVGDRTVQDIRETRAGFRGHASYGGRVFDDETTGIVGVTAAATTGNDFGSYRLREEDKEPTNGDTIKANVAGWQAGIRGSLQRGIVEVGLHAEGGRVSTRRDQDTQEEFVEQGLADTETDTVLKGSQRDLGGQVVVYEPDNGPLKGFLAGGIVTYNNHTENLNGSTTTQTTLGNERFPVQESEMQVVDRTSTTTVGPMLHGKPNGVDLLVVPRLAFEGNRRNTNLQGQDDQEARAKGGIRYLTDIIVNHGNPLSVRGYLDWGLRQPSSNNEFEREQKLGAGDVKVGVEMRLDL